MNFSLLIIDGQFETAGRLDECRAFQSIPQPADTRFVELLKLEEKTAETGGDIHIHDLRPEARGLNFLT